MDGWNSNSNTNSNTRGLLTLHSSYNAKYTFLFIDRFDYLSSEHITDNDVLLVAASYLDYVKTCN